jgi:hypothetical protein
MLHSLKLKVASVTGKESAQSYLKNPAFEEKKKAFQEYST